MPPIKPQILGYVSEAKGQGEQDVRPLCAVITLRGRVHSIALNDKYNMGQGIA